jgi:hypothetical protein
MTKEERDEKMKTWKYPGVPPGSFLESAKDFHAAVDELVNAITIEAKAVWKRIKKFLGI